MMHLDTNGGRGPSEPPAGPAKIKAADATIDEATIAAIALALELESQPEARRIATDRGTSFWALAGRAPGLYGMSDLL